jgi:hypothetical protein
MVTLNLTLPYPYVTQGAQPIHAYDGVTVIPGSNGQECYIPGNGFFVDSTQVVLGDYLPQRMGSSTTVSVTLTVPATGFVSLNMHLDYGLKRTTGYAKGGPIGNDAIDPTTLQVHPGPQFLPVRLLGWAGVGLGHPLQHERVQEGRRRGWHGHQGHRANHPVASRRSGAASGSWAGASWLRTLDPTAATESALDGPTPGDPFGEPPE